MNDSPVTDEDTGRIRELTVQECLDRVATQQIGRLAVVLHHYPQVFCVNYRLDDFVVVFRTGPGTKLLAAHHENVGFEVDRIDPAEGCGWSVLIRGMAEDVTDRRQDFAADRARSLDIRPWVPGDHSRLVRVIPAKISGREFSLLDAGRLDGGSRS